MKRTTLVCLLVACRALAAADIAPDSVLAEMKNVADWQMAHEGKGTPNGWVQAPFFMGLLDLAAVSGDGKYRRFVYDTMQAEGWDLDGGRDETRKYYHGRPEYFADDHAIGQVYLDYYRTEPAATRKDEWIAATREVFDEIVANPSKETLDIANRKSQERWSWCDALFMGPPTLVRLSVVTGDRKYVDFSDREYWATVDYLFDEQENLFFRDSRFFDMKTEPGGKKTFWSRGNGWVYAGLARMIGEMPESYAPRRRYVDLFRKMSGAILDAQQPSGAWFPSLLDPEQNGMGEASGTAFFVFGLAWGVNHGVLTDARYREAALRGWKALEGMVLPGGKLGSVQAIGDKPTQALDPEMSVPYGTGAFLLAGCEVYRMVGGE